MIEHGEDCYIISTEMYQAERAANSNLVYGYLAKDKDGKIQGLLSTDKRILNWIKDDTLQVINTEVASDGRRIINCFNGIYGFLSNFYHSYVEYEGITYANSESAFQAQKCTANEDKFGFCKLTPNAAKRAGKHVQLREDWETVKDDIMYNIVKAKFMQNDVLRRDLIDTGDAILIEGNDWGDRYWGVDNKFGLGQNKLGNILMRVRDELKQ